MSRPEPGNVAQIAELHKYKKIIPAIYAFNALVLDEKTKWYSEVMGKGYFSTRGEYDTYMDTVNHKPMDFSTIRKRITKNKYKKPSSLFHDMQLVFKNAMIFNNNTSTWYAEAQRLGIILESLKEKKGITAVSYKPSTDRVRACPQCNNIMISQKTMTPRRCGECPANISGQRMDCYICHNHSDHSHNFCTKCVLKHCYKCSNWHVGKRCNATKKSNRSKPRTHETSTNVGTLNLAVPAKPHNIDAVSCFESVKCKSTLIAKMVTIIKQIKNIDGEEHFFKKVDHPQYAELVSEPIHFGQILKRMNKNKYHKMGDIKRDIELLWSNCYQFNGRPNLNNPQLCGFANWASEVEATLNEYITEFTSNLTAQGWISSATSSTISSKSSKKSKHKSKKKKKKKDKNDDENNRTQISTKKKRNNNNNNNNKQSLNVKQPNTMHNIAPTINNVKITNNNYNKKQNIINDDDVSSISSIDNDNDEAFTNNKQPAFDLDKLLTTNAQFYEMTNKSDKTDTKNHKQSKKRGHASYSDTDDEEDTHKAKKQRIVPSASPPLSGISASSTEMNQAPTIPITPNPPNAHIPQKRKFDTSHFEFNNDSNIEAPPTKKRKISTSEPSVYGITDGMHNNVNPITPNLMPTNPLHYQYPAHSVISNGINTMHHNNMYTHSIHHNTAASVADVDPSIAHPSTTSHLSPNHHSRIHTSPSTATYNPAMTEISDYRLNGAMYPSHNMMQQYNGQYNGSTPQQIFINRPYPLHPNQYDGRTQQIQLNHNNHSVQSGSPPNTKRKKLKKLKLKRSSALSQTPAAYSNRRYSTSNTVSPIEYHLGMAEKLITESTPYIPSTAGSLQPTNYNPQQSTVTTSTSSSINSQQHIPPSTSHNSHSNEYTDNIYHTNIIEKIIKGIYSKATSLDEQDRGHPAKTFESIDKFPQPHGITPIAIFDIHQKLTNNKEAYKALWEAYYDFAYIWTAQIHYNTNARIMAQSFGKYVDEIFNNVLQDVDVFQSIKSKANTELHKVFKMNRITYNDERSVGTIAYKHAEHLFAAPKTQETIVPMKMMQRITSDRTDDSECKPILSSIRHPPPFVVDASVSPSIKSEVPNDRISVASHHSKTSKDASIPTNAVPAAISNPTISPIKSKPIIVDKKDKKDTKHSKKKKKKDKKEKKKKKKDKEKKSKKKKIKNLKTRPKQNQAMNLKTRPKVKRVSLTIPKKTIPTKTIPKVATIMSVLLSPSPPPPNILIRKMDEMSDSDSFIDIPFLLPSHNIDIEAVPSPPTFIIPSPIHDDNCSLIDNEYKEEKTNKDFAVHNDNDSEPFNLTKIPKKKAVTAEDDEPLIIAIDSDDDDDVIAEQQIQEAHRREIEQRQLRIKEKQEKEKKEKEKKEKEAKEAEEKLRREQQIAHQKEIEKQKEIEIEKLKLKQKEKEKENVKSKPKRFKLSLNNKGKKKANKSGALKALPSIVKSTPKRPRPIIERKSCFGDHLFKEQRALRLYHEFKRTETGTIFDNENWIKGKYGLNPNELISQNTFALRLVPYLIERSEFINLPNDLEMFYKKLFDLAQNAVSGVNGQNLNVLSLKFAKYHFNLLFECFVLNPDYEWRRHYPQIDSDFVGKKWVKLVYRLKELCIKHRFNKLFEAFDPAIRPEDDAEISCAAIHLWRTNNVMTLYEIELKLQNKLYINNSSIKHDLQSALDNLREIFHENEGYRCFIDKLRNEWIDFKTEFITNLNENIDDEKENLSQYYSIFDTMNECISYFYDFKTPKQKAMAQQLKVKKIIEDRIITTKSEGDCCFYYVLYKDFESNIVWEPKLYMLEHYREETKEFIKNKKKYHLDILLTHPSNTNGNKAFLNEQNGWIPRYQEQFPKKIVQIPTDLRNEINRIAKRKTSILRKKAKEKQKEIILEKQEIIKKEMNDNSSFNFWKETCNESSSSFKEKSINMMNNELSFSFKSKKDDSMMSSSSQSIFSQNTLSTLSTQSPPPTIHIMPLTVLTSLQSNASNTNDDDDDKVLLKNSLLPTPPPMVDPSIY